MLQVSWVIKFLIFFGCISVRRNRSRKARKSGNVVLSFYCCCFRWGVCLQEKYICFYSESETSYQSHHYMKPCLKIPNISRSTGNVYARIIILNLVALWSFVLSKYTEKDKCTKSSLPLGEHLEEKKSNGDPPQHVLNK